MNLGCQPISGQVTLAEAQSNNQDYEVYHQQVNEAENLIATENYVGALGIYDSLFRAYHFIFLREYQIATQLALHINQDQKAQQYLKQGILAGWKKTSIKRNNYLSKYRKHKFWKIIKRDYPTLRSEYQSGLNDILQREVKKMFSKDQRKALGAIFTFSSKAQDRYAEKKFAPHSEKQIALFTNILETCGYPGERLIGNDFWMSTILSHHNSISQNYVEQDTLYLRLEPKLKVAVKNGQMSPWEFALIDEWQRTVISNKSQAIGYGILLTPKPSDVFNVNDLRRRTYLRTIELRDGLIKIEKKTGMNFYLAEKSWIQNN